MENEPLPGEPGEENGQVNDPSRPSAAASDGLGTGVQTPGETRGSVGAGYYTCFMFEELDDPNPQAGETATGPDLGAADGAVEQPSTVTGVSVPTGSVDTAQVPTMVTELRDMLDRLQRSTVTIDTTELMADIKALQLLISAATAAQTLRIAQFAARSSERTEEGTWVHVDTGLGHCDQFASDTLAPVLGMSHRPAAARVETAIKLSTHLPVTLRALADGQLDPYRAQLIADETLLANNDTCTAVEELTHPDICADTPTKLRRRVRRALAQIDADTLRQRAERAHAERFIRTRPGLDPGIAEWFAHLPAAQSAQCWAAIDALAHRRKNDDPSIGIDQARADAFTDLILNNATITTQLTIALPADMIHGLAPDTSDPSTDRQDKTEQDGTDRSDTTSTRERGPGPDPDQAAVMGTLIPGIGIIPVTDIKALINTLGTTITRMVINADTGTTTETAIKGYRPSTAIRKHITARDGTCRFPNCAIRADRCELDHITPWPHGPTKVNNLIALCKHHHRLKHSTRWRLVLHPDGTAIWTDPYGQQWATHPTDHRLLDTA